LLLVHDAAQSYLFGVIVIALLTSASMAAADYKASYGYHRADHRYSVCDGSAPFG
jgi:hypothetical protein